MFWKDRNRFQTGLNTSPDSIKADEICRLIHSVGSEPERKVKYCIFWELERVSASGSVSFPSGSE